MGLEREDSQEELAWRASDVAMVRTKSKANSWVLKDPCFLPADSTTQARAKALMPLLGWRLCF